MGYSAIADDALMRPIEVAGKTVGWLAVTPFQNVTEAGGERFRQYLVRTSLAVGVLSLLLAMLIAWWIARTLLDPVKRVAAATHRLAAGEYSNRVSVASNDEVGQLARDFNQLAYTLERNEKNAPGIHGRCVPRTAHPVVGIARRAGSHRRRRAHPRPFLDEIAARRSQHAQQTGG
nr:hypothetical protein GCM10020185_64000 [Pseudomonas brassicacearum subsp. brassicacearum]